MKHVARRLIWGLLPLLLIGGCDRPQEKQPAPQSEPAGEQPASGPEAGRQGPRLVVPAEVRGQWQAVKIAVRDKQSHQEQTYTVDIGSEFKVPDSDLVLEVQTFLPAFIMDEAVMTSASNELKNPAVRIAIRKGGERVYKGWLFSLYPGTHAFQHPRFTFTLVDFVPAEKEKG